MMDIEEFCDGYYPENLSDNINVAGNHKEPPLEKCWEKMQSDPGCWPAKDVAYRSISASKRGMMVLKKKASKRGMMVLKKKKIRSNKRPAWQSPYPL